MEKDGLQAAPAADVKRVDSNFQVGSLSESQSGLLTNGQAPEVFTRSPPLTHALGLNNSNSNFDNNNNLLLLAP